MGLAASQARLLSLTSRISDNELRSQSITAAKLALSNQTSEASRKYMNALNKTEYIYRTYDQAGDKVYVDLTAAQLSVYGPLKNQYGVVNSNGQILVSELDSENYKNSKNVIEFIQKYGFNNSFKEETYEQINYDKYNSDYQEYTTAYGEWLKNKPDESKYWETVTTETEKIEKYHPNPEPEMYIDDPTWVDPSTQPGWEESNTWSLYEAFMEGTAGGCFTCSSNPASTEYNIIRHYNHTLGHMIVGGTSYWQGDWWWSTPDGGVNGTSGDGKIMAKIAEAIVGKTACGESTADSGSHTHTFYGTTVDFDCGNEHCDGTELITDKIKKLMQDIGNFVQTKYNGNLEAKGNDNDSEWIALKQRYYHIIEHDLKGILEDISIPKEIPECPQILNPEWEAWSNEWEERTVTETTETEEFNQEKYDEDYADWESKEPVEPQVGDYNEKITRLTEDYETNEGLWYINLWHRMNGASNYKITINGFDNGVHDPDNDGVIAGDNVHSLGNGYTPNGKIAWDVLEDGLYNSPEWLKYALESGAVSLERVNYTNPTEIVTGLEPLKQTWTSIIHTNALDISEQTDETAIAKAEAEYEQKSREIESKDKQYDSMFKLLDTEHSALQQEYETAKAVITKY